MNLLILEKHQFISSDTAMANARQSAHIRSILKLSKGATVTVGVLNGDLGSGEIIDDSEPMTIGNIRLNRHAPPSLPITLLLAMPRPQMLKRIVQTVATMGVKKLCFLQTSRVEKSFWQSPSATDEAIKQHLILGLEQGMATQLPVVEKYRRFRPFIEDHLGEMAKASKKLIADPGGDQKPQAHTMDHAITLAIGPEGGFIEKEVAYFQDAGFESIHLGKRILKVETAVPTLLAKLYDFEK